MMRNSKSITIFSFLLLMLFTACEKENMLDVFKRTGPIVTVTREVTGFNKIFAEDNVNVFITQDNFFEVKIEAGKNLISMIETEVTDGTLFIRNKNTCNWARSYDKPLNIYITMPEILYITSNGTGNIVGLNTFTTDLFNVRTKNSGDIELTVNNTTVYSHMHGSGNVTMHGTTIEHACSIGGTGYLYCSDLQTRFTWLQTFTTGTCYVMATDLLTCLIDLRGDVYCYGRPTKVEQKSKGEGLLYLR